MENKYTLKFTFAIEIQIDKLFTLVLVTSVNKFSCKYFSIKCSSVCCYLTREGRYRKQLVSNGVKPVIHQSELSPFSRKKFLSLCSIVKTTEWNGLIKIDN